ncbi:hypothetical protein ACIBG8_54240 [Nonomuraea sp. NPDC050556]|uniref:hypothetical protein n=1 Tax=Nonomuraea sp. NPDC050556 TaxID=3364369 RepID=UPI00379EC45D
MSKIRNDDSTETAEPTESHSSAEAAAGPAPAPEVVQVCIRIDYPISNFPHLPVGRPVRVARTDLVEMLISKKHATVLSDETCG